MVGSAFPATLCEGRWERPMRESTAAIALIRRQHEGQTLWLAQWNRNWQRYHFVGGHKHPDESFRQCVIREVCEELNIVEGEDFLVADQPLAHLDYTAWSTGARQETHYVMELFDVQIVGDSAWHKVASNDRNRWLTETEIREQRCPDGQAVSETMSRLLVQAKLI